MMVMMFLLVSAAALLVNPAVANPATHRPASGNLNEIIPEARKYNRSLTRVRAHLVTTTVFFLVNFIFATI